MTENYKSPNERDIHIFMNKYYVMSDGLIIIKTKAAKHFPQSGMATWINQHCKVQASISSKNISMIV